MGKQSIGSIADVLKTQRESVKMEFHTSFSERIPNPDFSIINDNAYIGYKLQHEFFKLISKEYKKHSVCPNTLTNEKENFCNDIAKKMFLGLIREEFEEKNVVAFSEVKSEVNRLFGYHKIQQINYLDIIYMLQNSFPLIDYIVLIAMIDKFAN